ncbi:MAG: bifunctional diaminohydroxyphosphoribosylaminopyrimidine deaminase/5-amino-6-(5-phosphoribosylamino)uracil reductase RibD [Gammaproteobacteria bacterium]|nr:bifunctional diaminohydroxyphosphoribosylaminopyrimidine deaminase/5-amino-6-(5-phosphoribosylamino)uracil reductase RibD [Gammaproteobacteria bacterium]
MASSSDFQYMAHALKLAERGLYTTDPNPRVGCVIVRDDKIVGEGWHQYAGQPHAEIHALKAAGNLAHGATAYVTLEPCCHHGLTPPCTDALIRVGIRRVVISMKDPNPVVSGCGIQELIQAGITVESGVSENSAEALNPGFISRMRKGRPFVRCKLAMSLDGRTAMASGESRWITSPAARKDVHRLRARSSAIITGINTILVDDPLLTARDVDADEFMQPLRVVVDTHLRIPESAKILTQEGRTIIATGSPDTEVTRQIVQHANIEVLQLPLKGQHVDLTALMDTLTIQQVNEVLVEAGSALSSGMLTAGLIDELIIYMAPHLMGSTAKPLFQLPGLSEMTDRIDLNITDIRAVGKDWRITAKVNNAAD